VPLRRDRIASSASELADLAGSLAGTRPVPARGVAMVSQLLADGGGPLYRRSRGEELETIIERAAQALTRYPPGSPAPAQVPAGSAPPLRPTPACAAPLPSGARWPGSARPW